MGMEYKQETVSFGALENRSLYPDVSEALPASFYHKTNDSIMVKVKHHKKYKQFYVPATFSHKMLVSSIKENFNFVYEGNVHVSTAYLLWFFFGFFGIHRFYLRQHSATSFWIWQLTGQLFGLGWVYDGIMLWKHVEDYNRRSLSLQYIKEESGFLHLLFGFKENERPSVIGAYILWFFFGWFGIHRWYTGHATPCSFLAWFVTGQIFGLGWLYDAFYTIHLVNYPKMASDNIPFFIKVLDQHHDYMPVNQDHQLSAALHSASSHPDKIMRLIVIEKYDEQYTYLLWVFFGLLGGHAWYLDLGNKLIRFFTGNYFFFGWVVEGIRMEEIMDEANKRLSEQFLPSMEGQKMWPADMQLVVRVIG